MIEAIIFDCFGVLTGDLWKEFVSTLSDDKKLKARDLNHALDRGFLSQKEFVNDVYELTGLKPEKVEDIINAEMSKNLPLFKYISGLSKKYKIGLLSNVSTDWVTTSFLSPDEAKMFDDILLSYQVGMIKPEPEIYHIAAKKLNTDINKCVFIDDSPANCQAAEKEGMTAIVYKNFNQMRAEVESLIRYT